MNLKSPQHFSEKLSKQWHHRATREARWFADDDAFLIALPIPAPTADNVKNHSAAVKKHLQAWKGITIGEVVWEYKKYQALAEPLLVPRRWLLCSVEEWIDACDNKTVREEYRHYCRITQAVSQPFHRTLIQQKRLVCERDSDEVICACQLAEQLSPNIAGGAPLRTLALAGVDSKFFERHRPLIIALLDTRYDGEVSKQGLETFLGASKDAHWVLVVDADGGLLPFTQQKVRVSELHTRGLPDADLLLVENIQVSHALPPLANTLVILGAGLNLSWLQADWTAHRRIRYWGDMDTWGLAMLARARSYRSIIEAVLMDRACFDTHQDKAVPEPTSATHYIADVWAQLTPAERDLYEYLQSQSNGRLEQEFLSADRVRDALCGK